MEINSDNSQSLYMLARIAGEIYIEKAIELKRINVFNTREFSQKKRDKLFDELIKLKNQYEAAHTAYKLALKGGGYEIGIGPSDDQEFILSTAKEAAENEREEYRDRCRKEISEYSDSDATSKQILILRFILNEVYHIRDAVTPPEPSYAHLSNAREKLEKIIINRKENEKR